MTGTPLAIAIVVVYLVLMLGIALRYRKFAGASLENFFLGGRRVPGWLNGISYTAALISPDAATAYGGLAVATGGFICWWYLSRFGLALFVGAVLFAVFWRRLNLFTSLEFYERRFPPGPAAAMRVWIGVRTSLLAMPAWTGITLLASCKIMEPALGLSHFQTLALVVPVSFVYVFCSGYQGVVVSNAVQMAVFFAGALTLAACALAYVGGPAGLAAALAALPGGAGVDMMRTLPPAEHAVFPLAAALAWLAGQTIGYGGDAAPMGGAMEGQRILSTRTSGEAVTMYVVTALSMFILLLLVTLPCMAAKLICPDLPDTDAGRELAYGHLMKALLRPEAMGLMVAAMLAAAMSTVADNLNFGSQVFVSDLYRRWLEPDADEVRCLRMGRLAMGLILALALTVALRAEVIYHVAVFMLKLSAAELPANWAQWWWWRFNGRARIAASFGGAAIVGYVALLPEALNALHVPGTAALILPWWWQTFLVMGLTTALWVAVALLTPPDPEPLLRGFHDQARPLGWWGPFRPSAARGAGGLRPILAGLGIAAAGAAATALLIVGLTHAWFGRFGPAAACLAAAAALFAAFRRGVGAFLRVLDDNGK